MDAQDKLTKPRHSRTWFTAWRLNAEMLRVAPGRKELGGAAPCGVDAASEMLPARQAGQTQSSPCAFFLGKSSNPC